jgi:hypothetical protein
MREGEADAKPERINVGHGGLRDVADVAPDRWDSARRTHAGQDGFTKRRRARTVAPCVAAPHRVRSSLGAALVIPVAMDAVIMARPIVALYRGLFLVGSVVDPLRRSRY